MLYNTIVSDLGLEHYLTYFRQFFFLHREKFIPVIRVE